MDTISGILVLILTVILWRLYHKIFAVVYVNLAVGLLREIVICFIIAVVIVDGIFSVLKIPLSSQKQEKKFNTPAISRTILDSEEKSSDILENFNILDSEESDPDILGNFYNLALLEGNGVNVWINFAESESTENGITVNGFASVDGYNYQQGFTVDIEWPEESHFTCYDKWHSSTLDITFNPEDHTLEIVQTSTDPDVPKLYSGTYVDNNVWEGLLDERRAATQAAESAREPQYWIKEYFGGYILTSFAEGEEDAPYLWFMLYENNYGNFVMDAVFSDPPENRFYYEIPYPRGNDEVGHIHYEDTTGSISFEILNDAVNGKHQIQITEFPYPQYIGTYIDELYEIDSRLGEGGKLLKWDGTYVCQNGGADGIKSITVTQIDSQTLSLDMTHTYADGREDSFYAVAEIDAFGNGPYFAAYRDEKEFTLFLEEDPYSNQKMITLLQVKINPEIDLDYDGVYMRQ